MMLLALMFRTIPTVFLQYFKVHLLHFFNTYFVESVVLIILLTDHILFFQYGLQWKTVHPQDFVRDYPEARPSRREHGRGDVQNFVHVS